MAIDLSVRTWSTAVTSLYGYASGSRTSIGCHSPPVRASFVDITSSPFNGGMTAAPNASVCGTKNSNVSCASVVPVPPVTDGNCTASTLLTFEAAAISGSVKMDDVVGLVATTRKYARFVSSTSVMTRFVIVCPAAISTSTRYCRGKFGPVAVSFSGPK